jgi:ABC-type dipeptide/oligopeptide/nickel transport system permease component/ABC-type dipeptide/oligopeptide/nickel transport system ATPase subunit
VPDPLLRVKGLTKRFDAVAALQNVCFDLECGRVLGLVGGSGSVKSTLARSIARFERPDSGEIRLDGRTDYGVADVQLIFQEAAASLSPGFTAVEILEEPLLLAGRGSPEARRGTARRWLESVGLPKTAAGKRAFEFSGGERQRLAIARALILEPKLLILDESLSGLDLLLQAQLTGLLRELRARLELTCILISHDLALASALADEIAVMHAGEIVERASAAELMAHPRHPRTAELVAASVVLALHSGEAEGLGHLHQIRSTGDGDPASAGAGAHAIRVPRGVRYTVTRALQGIALLIAISFAAFAFAQLAPGDYFSDMRVDPRITPETVETMRRQAGLHRPFLARYVSWASSIAHGDWGESLAYGAPVAALLRERICATLLLTGTATAAAWLLAIPLGIWSATRRGGWLDAISKFVLTVLLVVPDLLLAIAVLVLAAETQWFPTGGMTSPDAASMTAAQRVSDLLRHLALPAGVLAVGMLPVLVRHVRASMVETLRAPFSLAARANGIPARRRLFRHLLPVAANPLVGLLGLSLGTLLSASLLVEVVMGWPGLGPLLVSSILSRDIAVVLGVILLSAGFLITGNLIADLLLYRLDPRIRVR